MAVSAFDSALHTGSAQDITLTEMTFFALMAGVIFIDTSSSRINTGNDFQFQPLSFAIDIDYFAQPARLINRIWIFVTTLRGALDFQA
jgi:hypothetical protein